MCVKSRRVTCFQALEVRKSILYFGAWLLDGQVVSLAVVLPAKLMKGRKNELTNVLVGILVNLDRLWHCEINERVS